MGVSLPFVRPKASRTAEPRPARASGAKPARDGGPSRAINIPPRVQWREGHGYCGETSIQSIGLHYGAWISQKVVREVAGSELLLGENDARALAALHFDSVPWDSDAPRPQFQAFMVWMKDHLLKGNPVIFGAYVSDADADRDYDHIMPATGIQSAGMGGYNERDVLIFNSNLDSRQLRRTVKSLEGTRKSCAVDGVDGGCIPRGVDYGVAVTGITDRKHATVPLSLSVDRHWETKARGAKPRALHGTLTIRDLHPGQKYAILRYDDYRKLPTNASAKQFLSSKYARRIDFVATGEKKTWADPKPFMSDGTVYYRCVPLQ